MRLETHRSLGLRTRPVGLSRVRFPDVGKRGVWVGLAAGIAAACGPSPTAPGTNNPPPAVTNVEVTSLHGSLLATGRSIQLQAQAKDENGQLVSVAFNWAVDDAAVARVDGDGTVSALARGRARITATAGSASGTFEVRVLDADLVRVSALLDDPFAEGLIDAVSGPEQAGLRAAWIECAEAAAGSNLTTLAECLDGLPRAITQLNDTPDRPIAALLVLVTQGLARLLDIDF